MGTYFLLIFILADPGFRQLVIRHMSGIIADGTSGIVNIVLFRALETVYNHTKALIYTFEEKYEKNLRRGTENKKK